MKYLSVCSGIEAATVAWHPLNWKPVAFAETDPQASAVLNYHYPKIPNHNDFTTIKGDEHGSIDLIVGGPPCQSFSMAGNRKGLHENRGNLSIEFLKLAKRTRARWVIWENVPGAMSSNKGRDFGIILGTLAKFGYGCAWRIMDAQFVRTQSHPRAVAQRRRRVFLIGYFGDWRPPAAVLFESDSMRRNSPPGRSKGAIVANTVTNKPRTCGFNDGDLVIPPFSPAKVTNTLDCSFGDKMGIDNQHIDSGCKLFVPFKENDAQTFSNRGDGSKILGGGVSYSLKTIGSGGGAINVISGQTIRRLTPIEFERLQGFPDNYTNIEYKKKPMSNNARYRMVGNSMAVNVMRWIGDRIQMFEDLKL